MNDNDRRVREWLAQSQAEAIAQRHERDLYADDDAPAVRAGALAEARQWLADLGVGAHGHERAIFAALDNPPTCDHLPPGAVEVSREVFDDQAATGA